ncbi:hypothetical protein H310_05463 [Aphanomyces invadans]|uniref:Uncharacterized protein n=1 Tax=Aphanomyces invadans TaxID=157072 RepID=A0A024UAW6_9STRA|nr:hypothetical protein H310_05463 [Aphanomyces invadans]ETW03032.1 hypothetical protein H310_05463 [Aphanomyces invadans]|eukprot:XP_008868416.1 hypothetical protein H310_05463 [Aphanomyces invadans]
MEKSSSNMTPFVVALWIFVGAAAVVCVLAYMLFKLRQRRLAGTNCGANSPNEGGVIYDTLATPVMAYKVKTVDTPKGSQHVLEAAI